MATIRDLLIRIGVDADDRQLKGFTNSVDNLKKSMSAATPLVLGFMGSIGLLGGKLIKSGAELEQLEVSFETLTGSAEKGKALMADLRALTLKTPFAFRETAEGAKQLLAYGESSETVSKTLENLGNIAAGVGRDKLPRLILALGQVKTAKFLKGSELRQFTEAGVGLRDELGKLGKYTKDQLAGDIGNLKIPFEDVQQAIENLTTGTGRFAGLMEKQSKTAAGQWSVFKDMLELSAMDIGKELLPETKGLVGAMTELVKENMAVIKTRILEFFKGGIKIVKHFTDKMGGLKNIMRAFGTILPYILAGLGALTLGYVALKIVAAAAWLVQIAPIVLIGAAIAALILIIDEIWTTLTDPKADTFLRDILNYFEKEFPAAFKIVKRVWQEVTDRIFATFDLMMTPLKTLVQTIYGLITGDWEPLFETWRRAGHALKVLFLRPFQLIWEIMKNIGNWFANTTGFKRIAGLFKNIFPSQPEGPVLKAVWGAPVNTPVANPAIANSSSVTQSNNINVTVNNPSSNVDVQEAIRNEFDLQSRYLLQGSGGF